MSSAPAPATKFPSGIVLGPDGKPCKVCTGFKAWSKVTKKATPAGAGSASTAAAAGGATTATLAAVALASDSPPTLPSDCPPDVERLGRHTWTFLHTTASYFPPQPTPHQKSSMLSLLHSLPTLYPCSSCADDLGAYMKKNPPEIAVEKGRTALEKWLCEVHNDVNAKLGKDKFECGSVGERWRDGWKDGRCD